MGKKLRWVFGLISLFYLAVGFAQQPFIRQLSYRDGLPTQVIYSLLSDRFGMLYLGTDRGLISFDGVRFVEHEFERSLGIAVNRIQQDHKGTIWCKNFANEIFYLKKEKLVQDPAIQYLLKKDESNLIDFLVHQEEMWILTENSVYYRKGKGSFKLLTRLKENLFGTFFTSITFHSQKNQVYVFTDQKLLVYNSDVLVKKSNTILGQKESVFFQNKLYYHTKGKENVLYNQNNQEVPRENQLKNIYYNKLGIADAQLWVCSSDGLLLYNPIKNKLDKSYLAGKVTTDLVQDKEGNYWISTLNEGLFMIPEKNIFNFHIPGLPENIVYTSIAKHQNRTYVGTSDGKLFQLNEKNEVVHSIQFQVTSEVEFIKIQNQQLFCSYGILPLDIKNGKDFKYLGKSIDSIAPGIQLVCSFNYGGLLVDTLKIKKEHLNYLKNNFEVSAYHNHILSFWYRNKRGRSVYHDHLTQQSYIGFSDGLYVFDLKGKGQEIQFQNQPIVASKMVGNEKGELWIGTSQNGLFYWKNGKIIRHYTTKNGMSGTQCKKLILDKEGLWILTNNGLNFLSFADYQIKNRNQNLSFSGINITDVALNNNQLWFTTNQGVFYFPVEVLQKNIQPLFKFQKIMVNNQEVFENQLTLDYHQNNLAFYLQGIHFKSLGDFNYEYRLLPLDSNWQKQKAINNQVKYLSLQPGNYTFESRIDLKEGNSKTLQYQFTIEKPFWKKLWFILLMILLLGGLLYATFQYATYRIKKIQLVKEQLALSQLTALRSQMNPHFLFNILNAVQGYIYSNQKTKASEYLGTFSDLIRKTLAISDQREITVAQEIEAIQLYVSLEKTRFEEDDFEETITIASGLDLDRFYIPSLIVQPFVENAIKHGLMHKKGKKILQLTVDQEGEYLIFTIKDNGIGREKAQRINQAIKKHQSFATKATQNRIEIMNKLLDKPILFEIKDIIASEKESCGTIVTLKIPIIQKK
ncbi:MAG: histidine kinase [Flavobacterium sp.]